MYARILFFVPQAFLEQIARTIEIDTLDHRRFIRRRTSFTGLCIFLVTAGICARRSYSKEIRNIPDFGRQQVFIAEKIYLSFFNILLGSVVLRLSRNPLDISDCITLENYERRSLFAIFRACIKLLHVYVVYIIIIRDKKSDSWQSIDITSVTSLFSFRKLISFLHISLSRAFNNSNKKIIPYISVKKKKRNATEGSSIFMQRNQFRNSTRK